MLAFRHVQSQSNISLNAMLHADTYTSDEHVSIVSDYCQPDDMANRELRSFALRNSPAIC